MERLIIDPTEEDALNVPLDLLAAPYSVTRFRTPTPPLDIQWGEPVDADGEPIAGRRYRNRRIAIDVEIVVTAGDDAARADAARDALAALTGKVAKVNREGGTLRRELPDGSVVTFDLLAQPDELDPSWDVEWDTARVIRVQLQFVARPFARGAEEARAVHSETELPVLIFVERDIGGDAPALGRLVVRDEEGALRRSISWGMQIASHDARTQLYYAADALTPLSGATLAGDVVEHDSLGTDWTAILSTGALTHVGEYRVRARTLRPSTNDGAVSIALTWGLGDMRAWTRNTAVAFGASEIVGEFVVVDLGLVFIPDVASQWEGRVIAMSTVAGDEVSVGDLELEPVERSGEAQAVEREPTPATITGRDEFDQSPGALHGTAAAVGGLWSSGGDAGDFSVDAAGHNLKRTVVGDIYSGGPVGRWAVLPPVKTDTAVQTAVSWSATPGDANSTQLGVLARWVNASTYAVAYVDPAGVPGEATMVQALMRIGGAPFLLGTRYFVPPLTSCAVRLVIAQDGSWQVHVDTGNGIPTLPLLSGQSSHLATGGTLAQGKDGLWDWWYTTDAGTRWYDGFRAWVPAPDAAVYGGRRLEVRHDGVLREDAGGTVWTPVSRYQGDYLTIPPSGPEGRSARFAVRAGRWAPGVGPEPAIDDLSAQLFVTPRYLVVP